MLLSDPVIAFRARARVGTLQVVLVCNACLVSPPLRKCRVGPKPTLKSRISSQPHNVFAVACVVSPVECAFPLPAKGGISAEMRVCRVARDVRRSAGATDVRVEPKMLEQRLAPWENSLWSARDLIRCLDLCGFPACARRYRELHEWASIFLLGCHYRTRNVTYDQMNINWECSSRTPAKVQKPVLDKAAR